MENLGAMAYSRYTGFREITDRDVLELHCIIIFPRKSADISCKLSQDNLYYMLKPSFMEK